MGVEIALAAGLSGAFATLTGAAINLAAGLGVSYAAQKLSGAKTDASAGAASDRGVAVSLQVAADLPRVALLGETATAGSLVYWQLYGADNAGLLMIIALADHECDGLSAVIVDDVRREVLPNGLVAGYGQALGVRFMSGAPGQVASPSIVSLTGGRWSANEKGVGVCYAIVTAAYSEEAFPGGIPKIQFVVRGAKLLDPRTGVVAYSDNWGVAVYNVLSGIRQTPGGLPLLGLNAAPGAVRAADIAAACNISDELVTLATGETEKRYRVGVALTSDQTTRDHLETLLAVAGGEIVESAGTYRVFAGAAQNPVAELTDADVIVDQPFGVARKRSRANLVNTVEGQSPDPRQNYVSAALPPRFSDADIAADGGNRLTRTLDLFACPSRTQAQRVMELERRRARRQLTATCTVRAATLRVEVGDWIAFTSERQGWDYKLFEVVSAPRSQSLTADLTLAEVDDALDDWSFTEEIGTGEAPVSLASAGPAISQVVGVSLANFVAATIDGAQRPGLRVSWAPVTDPTVTGLRLEYRRLGDEGVTFELDIPNANAGTFSTVNGVLGGVRYEARLLLNTQPQRGVEWTAWVATPADTEAYVVPVAAYAETVNPANLPPAELSAQERFELSLATGIAELQGSVAAAQARALTDAQNAAEAALFADLRARNAQTGITEERNVRQSQYEAIAQQIVQVQALLGEGVEAAITAEQTARVEADEALASSVTTLTTALDGNTTSIQALLETTNGIGAKFSVSISQDGYATGFITLDQVDEITTFGVLADKFFIAQPGVAGGDPKAVFTVGQVGGVPSIGINGNAIIDGTVSARHIEAGSITANEIDVDTLTVRRIASANNLSFVDFTTGNNRIRLVS